MSLIPKVMSTQHPDNAAAPAYAIDGVIKGDGEIAEAVDVFGLGCDEQMWDSEGKDTDTHVVQKLLTNYPQFFHEERKLGRDAVITLRVPNPAIEMEMRKLMVEALQGITTAYDVAREFYGGDLEPPIQEIILPFTTSADELSRIAAYYERFIVGQEDSKLLGDSSVRDWIGEFLPKRIRVIPLVESRDQMLTIDDIVREYLRRHEEPFQRVFLARSDPALNYGMVGAEILLKISLRRIDLLAEEIGIPLYPIIGAGSVPFRGHLKPTNIPRALLEYPSVRTLTVQSAFKFDYALEQVQSAIAEIHAHEQAAALPIDEPRAIAILDKVAAEYQRQVRELAPRIASVSGLSPRRRERKLHVGLFGYGRSLSGSDDDVTLPRAIAFTAALYSMGAPPELLGLAALDQSDFAYLREIYPSMEEDLAAALRYANETRVTQLLGDDYRRLLVRFTHEIDRVHEGLTTAVWASLRQGAEGRGRTTHYIEEAGRERRFLG